MSVVQKSPFLPPPPPTNYKTSTKRTCCSVANPGGIPEPRALPFSREEPMEFGSSTREQLSLHRRPRSIVASLLWQQQQQRSRATPNYAHGTSRHRTEVPEDGGSNWIRGSAISLWTASLAWFCFGIKSLWAGSASSLPWLRNLHLEAPLFPGKHLGSPGLVFPQDSGSKARSRGNTQARKDAAAPPPCPLPGAGRWDRAAAGGTPEKAGRVTLNSLHVVVGDAGIHLREERERAL